ncbi:MAG TPA: pantoate--beta-alanine ligase, partial [Chitinophagaceae bacterium]|nr:pantoate--beta-alanine ligase [Chitinophagaceae bacterium]
MIICKQSSDINNYLSAQRKKIRSVGFVPTMGALHEGHISLIKQSKKKTGLTVCSIFVNPVQFNNAEDFEKYPSTIENDILLLEENGCDILFVPSEREMYPDESSKHKQYALGYLEEILEGKFRPGHFQGVCLVVEKLLNIVRPDILFLGQKDYQQCLVIKKLVRLMGSRVKVKIEPIIREKNGLAMS